MLVINGVRIMCLGDIYPESIEFIEIVKGASAASSYGIYAIDGVIVNFTKKGASSRWTVSTARVNYPMPPALQPRNWWILA
jgi:outer membrane cobalamin receptor